MLETLRIQAYWRKEIPSICSHHGELEKHTLDELKTFLRLSGWREKEPRELVMEAENYVVCFISKDGKLCRLETNTFHEEYSLLVISESPEHITWNPNLASILYGQQIGLIRVSDRVETLLLRARAQKAALPRKLVKNLRSLCAKLLTRVKHQKNRA